MEHYVFPSEVKALACVNYINNTPWFPVVGRVNGAIAPEDKQKTTKWVEAHIELLSGEWAVPRVPDSRLNYLSVPQADRAEFLAVFGNDIRTLTISDLGSGRS